MHTRGHSQRGLLCTEYTLNAPLDHSRPDSEQIEVYAREVVEAAKVDDPKLPRLLFLQGGPGGKSPRPSSRTGWIGRALKDYRVVLLDQRGTGLSTPANRQTLARRGGPAEQAAYLAHFRADAIVRDAELLPRELQGDEPWTILGQSYGGFCATTYLSFAPAGLKEVFITGGLPPLSATADEIYAVTYARVVEKNAAYFERHPDDRELCARIEACYCQGAASRWSAERLYARRPEFALNRATSFLFTGEMIFPFIFEEDPSLVPLRDTAHLLAEKDDWPALYDADQLARNEVPVFAALYFDDMYVAREFSLATASAVRRVTPWVTNEYEHDGLRVGDVLDRLLTLARQTP
jgi:pimeloyl-ACP methyl ester carboxylesterase